MGNFRWMKAFPPLEWQLAVWSPHSSAVWSLHLLQWLASVTGTSEIVFVRQSESNSYRGKWKVIWRPVQLGTLGFPLSHKTMQWFDWMDTSSRVRASRADAFCWRQPAAAEENFFKEIFEKRPEIFRGLVLLSCVLFLAPQGPLGGIIVYYMFSGVLKNPRS